MIDVIQDRFEVVLESFDLFIGAIDAAKLGQTQ